MLKITPVKSDTVYTLRFTRPDGSTGAATDFTPCTSKFTAALSVLTTITQEGIPSTIGEAKAFGRRLLNEAPGTDIHHERSGYTFRIDEEKTL
jgi:hypothetical protein